MTKTPDTYESVEEAVELIEAAARRTDALGRTRMESGWNDLQRMYDDVHPEVFERGLRRYTDDEDTIEYMLRETKRRKRAFVMSILDGVTSRPEARS